MQPEIIFLIVWAVGMVVLWPLHIAFTLRSRTQRGEPISPKPPPDALFVERRASGVPARSLFGASGCLMVVVTKDQLWTAVIFPLNLVVPHGAFGLEQRVSKRGIKAEMLEGVFRHYNIRVTLEGPKDHRR